MQQQTDKSNQVAAGIFGGQKCAGDFVARNARSSALARRTSRAFTVVELLVVISIMGIISALVVGLANMSTGKRDKSRVRAELEQLVAVIDSFKSKVGDYPRDNPTGPGTNQLYYELSGTVYVPATTQFQDRDGNNLPVATINSFFGVDGFVNADEAVRPPVPNFIKTFKPSQWQQINVGAPPVYVLKVPVKGPNGALITWNYNSTSPTNNPGRYDLWADFPVGTNTVRISNWNRQPIIVN